MRRIFHSLALVSVIAGCERVPVYEARLEGQDVSPFTAYQEPGTAPREWTVENDEYRLYAAAHTGTGRLHLYVRTQTEPSTTPAEVFWSEGALPFTMDVATECQSSVEYFDNPGNSFAINFLKSEYPEVYTHSPATEAPGLSAILVVESCVGSDVGVRISVLDESGAPLREHELTARIERVDWYYNPLWP